MSVQRQRNEAHALSTIHPLLSSCKIKLSVSACHNRKARIFFPAIRILLLCRTLAVCWPPNTLVYFTLLHEEAHYLKSKWIVWFSLSHLIKGLKYNLHTCSHGVTDSAASVGMTCGRAQNFSYSLIWHRHSIFKSCPETDSALQHITMCAWDMFQN